MQKTSPNVAQQSTYISYAGFRGVLKLRGGLCARSGAYKPPSHLSEHSFEKRRDLACDVSKPGCGVESGIDVNLLYEDAVQVSE